MSDFRLQLATQYNFSDSNADTAALSIFNEVLNNVVPEATENSNKSALNCYTRWVKSLDRTIPGNRTIPEDFKDLRTGRMNYVLGRFVMEARDLQGVLYTTTTLYSYVAALNHCLGSRQEVDSGGNPVVLNLMESPCFK